MMLIEPHHLSNIQSLPRELDLKCTLKRNERDRTQSNAAYAPKIRENSRGFDLRQILLLSVHQNRDPSPGYLCSRQSR